MKQKPVLLIMIGAIALLALMAGCATTTHISTQDKRDMLLAAGFKTISPKTPAQQQKLQQLKTGQVVQIQKNGKTYYVVADPSRNVVYVGGPTEVQAYQQIRAQRQLDQEDLAEAEGAESQMYQDAAMNWDAWGGWGVGWGRMGYPIGVRRF